ncbi:hypothetical protein C8J56DRAFT_309701 [Mycena floridula]|nr:hypothetical protein C8J56DRAFT_309701 [Mycena floridula]
MPKDARKRTTHHEPSVKIAVEDAETISEFSEFPSLKKKEKQQIRRDILLQRLEQHPRIPRTGLSHSSLRRLKCKTKEQLEEPSVDPETPNATPAVKVKPGQIGSGRPVTLSKQQRKRVLEKERLRHPLVLSELAKSNPFEKIRLHATNTLVKHQTPI